MTIFPLPSEILARIKPPIVILTGSPRPVADLIARLGPGPITCWQMDCHQADRLREELATSERTDVEVTTTPDLWDLPTQFQTAILPAHAAGERELKLDLLDQAQHILLERGLMVSLSEVERDSLFAPWHKKIYGRCSELRGTDEGCVFWSVLEKAGPRRRHELNFHARIGEHPSLNFLSRPGIFSYGKFDNGSRALLECAEIEPGDRILDLGCGVGANGILAMQRAGPSGHVTFVDSNARAIALTEINAKANGLTNFRTLLTPRLEGLRPGEFTVVLANPPYFASGAIARLFIEGARPLLKRKGRFYLVTKLVNEIEPIVREFYEEVVVYERRGYSILAGVAGVEGSRCRR